MIFPVLFEVFSGLMLMLVEIQGTPVFSAAASLVPSSEQMNVTIKVLRLLKHETDTLFEEYVSNKLHSERNNSVPPEVPDVSVSGVSAEEKLQSVYSKTRLFTQHVHQVQLYHKEKFANTEPLKRLYAAVFNRCGYFVSSVQQLLRESDSAVPPSPPPLTVHHPHRFHIKVYGWAVLLRLQEWLTRVEQVLLTVKGHG
uniref:Ciliary neurotrophic factor n=1 Tax=Periophthalmus magnuspinnatus TaxID=409849 RepID=A0A3B4A5B1_9GOBI